jgi:hypothetical protein
MKKIVFISLLLPLMSFFSPQKMVVKGTVLYTEAFCEVKKQSPEYMAELRREKPFANKMLYIKVLELDAKKFAAAPVLAKVKTDENGNFSLNLERGAYAIITERKMKDYSRNPNHTMKYCKEWIGTLDMKFIVAKGSANETTVIRYFQECNPCEPFK